VKKKHLEALLVHMEKFLNHCDEDGGNPELCSDKLAQQMAKAAEAVYDSSMESQKFAREYR
jgi:hypothetical protein